MTIHTITTKSDIDDLKIYIAERGFTRGNVTFKPAGALVSFEAHETFDVNVTNLSFSEKNDTHKWLKSLATAAPATSPAGQQERLIFGKDPTTNVVSIEAKDGSLELFIEKDGVITTEVRQNQYWLLAPRAYDKGFSPLAGNLHYKYIKTYSTKKDFYADKNKYRQGDTYSIANEKEAAMLTHGITYYKNMKVNDVSRFHFDLETIGFLQAKAHRILCISTTYLSQGSTKKKLFSVDEYDNDADMLLAFCAYLRECNPSIVSGFHIFGFDFPYLQLMADKLDIELSLGRDSSVLRTDKYTSKFRKDGSQDYDYNRCHIYGREIVDMMFVAYHFDFARKYESYRLKSIIAQEGLEKANRQHYDAANIAKNWHIYSEREKIKEYCIDDSDDSESLYQLMIASYFYFCRSIPKSFQTINYSATGSQLNSLLVRSYLQEAHSIPKADEAVKFEGAISDGFPGIYSNVFKVDVASLYPSIMLQYNIYDVKKDPKGNFISMIEYFTKERLINKKLGKETGDRYYKDLEQSQKIGINSGYGLLGATGLNFNYPSGAARVTEKGRDILKTAVLWATGKPYIEKKEEEDEIQEAV